MNAEQIKKQWTAGFTRRWHTNPDLCHTVDTVDAHSARVARLMYALCPHVGFEGIAYALVHDLGECVTGDIPAPFKRSCETVETELAIKEFDAVAGLGFSDWIGASYFEASLLNLCDKMDAYLWAKHHAPHIIERDDWRESLATILRRADELDLGDKVRGVLGCDYGKLEAAQ